MSDRAIQRLRHKLERLELDRLREMVVDLHQRLQAAEEQVTQAEEVADYWRQAFWQLEEATQSRDFNTPTIGITQDGRILVQPHTTPTETHP